MIFYKGAMIINQTLLIPKYVINKASKVQIYFDVITQTPSQSFPGGFILNMLHRSI